MKLKKVESVEIVPTAPFNFDATFYKPDHFTTGDNSWMPSVRWQTWLWRDKPLGLKFINIGSIQKPKLKFEIFCINKLPKQFVDTLIEEIKYRYNLNLNLTDFYKQFEKDKILGPIIKRLYGMRPGHPNSLYEYLIIGIVLQNATVKRSIQMFKSLLENYGTKLEYDEKTLWCFWSPGGLKNATEQSLRNLKIGYRAKFIKRIDNYFGKGLINEIELRKKDRETQMEELLNLYGIGPATVWYLLFDVFHHWDFFNHISPWEQKIYSKIFFNQDPENPLPKERLLKYFERFGKYKQLAVHYVWEDLWWRRKDKPIPWLEKLIRT